MFMLRGFVGVSCMMRTRNEEAEAGGEEESRKQLRRPRRAR